MQKYGRLAFIKEVEKGCQPTWEMQCDCGKIKVMQKQNVVSGKSSSCGCLRAELVSQRKFKHGEATNKTKLYWVWLAMRDRCNNSKNESFAGYGGRGIRVCERWNDYALFKQD